MKSWHQNWDAIIPIFKFSTTVRKGYIYHERNRKPERHIPEAESSEERVSKRYSPFKSAVLVNI